VSSRGRSVHDVVVSDGPFAETREFIAGFDILECADLERQSRRPRGIRSRASG
jgi:hypothetical protein